MSPKKINVTDSGSDSDSATSSSSDESSSSSSSDASSSSSSSSSLSGSDDTSPTKSEHLSSSSGDDEQPTRSRKSSKDLAKLAEELPDLYGIRRSSRARKEPTRLEIGKGQAGKRGKRSRRKSSADWNSSDDSESSGSSSEGSVEKFKPTRGRRPQKSRGRTRGRGGKRKTYSDSDEESTPERRTTSSRSAAHSKKISYRENSGESQTDDDDVLEWTQPEKEEPEGPPVETIEKVLKRRIGRKMASGSKTAIYIVQEEGDPNEGFDPDKEEGDVQYLIKWKNWSYIHNTWDSEKNLMEQKVNGLKKLDNFKKFRNELEAWKRLATPEDIEYLEYQNEMVVELADTHLKVERIITHQASRSDGVLNVFPDYLIKWQGLPYSDCTWEAGELISKKFHSSLEEYNTRNKAQTIPSKYCKALKTRPKFQTYKEQPDYLGSAELQLRDYQLDGLNWLVRSWCKENSVILADEMGLGKTIQIISFVSSLMYSHQLYGPFLIVVPLSTIVAWQREFQLWVPKINVVLYIGDIQSRNRIREFEWAHPGNKRLKFNVIVTTYEILLKDKSFLGSVHWAALAVDEAHRLKNDDSLLYKSLIDFKTNHRVLVTGTPLQNSLKELWSLLHFIMPDRFNSWSEFEEKHQNSDNTGFSSLHKQLEPFLLRRMKKDVEKSLPSKTEQILRVEMTKQQKQYYRWILTKNYKALSKGVKGSISGFLNIVMELKKCCNHCFLTRAPEDEDNSKKDPLETVVKSSGKMILLDKLLMRLRDTGHRVLIFSQMVRLLDILAEYMKLRHFQFQRLDGSIQGEQRKQAMDHFNAEGSEDFCFLLSTRAGGLGVNLASADTVIIFDSDWNPQNDLQAMARAHRIGQKKQVSVYRLVTKGSVEEDIIERAKQKMVLDHLVIQRMDTTGRTVLNKGMNSSGSNPFNKAELACILKFGAEDLFKENEDEEGELQVDIDEILKRAETTHTEAHNSATDDLLSNFKVVSFDNLEDQELEGRDAGKDWDNIIPSKDRQIIEDEEEARRLKELNLPPRQRKQVTQFNAYDSDDDKENKKKKKSSKYDDEESSYDEDSDEDKSGAKKKCRGRGKGKIDGFNTSEIRRFVKSFKKFPKPLDRLEDISGDAELQEKSHSDLHRLGQIVMEQCQITMTEHEKQLENGTPEDNDGAHKKSSRRGPTALIGSVAINAKQVIQSAYELDPLAVAIPADKEKRKKYQLTCRVKFVNWDCVWEPEDDSNLLKGIYEYGMGSWEAIKMDPELNLHDKILPDGKLKPQVNHISTRAEYLIKVLRKDLNMEDSKTPPIIKTNKVPRAKKTKANPRVKSAEIITDDISDESDENRPPNKNDKLDESFSPSKDNSAKRSKKKRQKEKKTSVERDVSKDKKKREKNDKKEKKEKHQKSRTGVYTESFEPVALDENGKPITELAPETFAQCKDKMRPVKKSLKQLDKSDPELNESEQEEHVRQCLMAIGDHIGVILSELQKTKSKSQLSQWRDHLWIFVAHFTEFDANKLHKIYRRAVNKRDGVSKMHSESKSHKSHGSHSGKKKRLSNDGPNDASQHKQKHRENIAHRQSAHQRQNKSQSLENFTDGSSQESWQNANGPRHHGHNNGPIGANEMWTHTSPLDRRMAGRDSNSYTKWSSGGSQHDQNFQHAGPSGGKQHGYHGNNQNRYGDGGQYGNKQFQRDSYKNRGGAGGTHEGGYSKHRREQGQHGAGGGGWRDRDPGGYHSNNKPNRENWQETGGFGGPNSNVYDRKRMRDPRDSSRENRESRPPKDQRMGESRTWSSHREEWGAYHPPRHHGSNENNGGGQNSYNKDNRTSEPGHASDPRMSRVKAQSTQSQYSSSPHH